MCTMEAYQLSNTRVRIKGGVYGVSQRGATLARYWKI